jgi:putative ABC transport system permease protein
LKPKNTIPPRIATNLLLAFLRHDFAEEVQGDLEEKFYVTARRRSLLAAKARYWYEVIQYIRPFAFKKSPTLPSNRFDMFRNYLTITTRNLLRQKLYSIINIGGLALGLACFITIMLYVQHEFSYNSAYPNVENIYRVYQRQAGNQHLGTDYFAVTPAKLASVMIEEVPGVVNATSVSENMGLITHGDNHFYEKGIAGDANFFSVLNMPFVEGNPATALTDPKSLVVTESLARTIFGDKRPIGEIVSFQGAEGFHVTAIIKDPPVTSSLQFTFIVSIQYNQQYVAEIKRAGWNNNSYYTFFVVAPGTHPADIESRFPALLSKYQLPEEYENYPFKDTYFVENMADIYFHPNINFDIGLKGNRQSVLTFAAIALIVLLLACVNYMNLAVARSIKRAREVGLRKMAGAVRRQLLGQFLAESMLITFISLLLAIGLVYLVVPYFGGLVERPVVIDFNTNIWLLPGLVGVVLLVGLLSGSYPALVMSSLRPIDVLKVKTDLRISGFSLQRALIILQFAASSALVIGSLIIYRQLDFIQNKDVGYDKEDIVAVRIRDRSMREKFIELSHKWAQNPDIIQATITSHLPTNVSSSTMIKNRSDGAKNDIAIYQLSTEYSYIDLFGLDLIAGRNFSRDFNDTTGMNFIFNETAARVLGYTPEEAVGKQFYQNDGPPMNIIGVVRDFHMHSMVEPIHPMMIRFSEMHGSYFSFRISPARTQETIASIERSIREVSPYPFEYEFLDDIYDKLYASETRLGGIFGTFTFISIIIASLGLFGLAAFTAGQRTKEIGIRKVLGASGSSIVMLVSRDFMKLVLFAFVIAMPISWYVMRIWLQQFAFRIDMAWWIFAVAGLLAFLIANISIGYQSVKAAGMDPVESLRGE